MNSLTCLTRTGVALWVMTLAGFAAAESLTMEQAREFSKHTGRPILAVAGSKT